MKVPEGVLVAFYRDRKASAEQTQALEAALDQLREELLARDWEEVNLIASERCPDLRPCPKCVVEAAFAVLGDKEKGS